MAKRAVIIGGGHNALVCACYLAEAGISVTLLEKRHLVGGAAVTESFHPGFRNSVASYTVSLLHPDIIEDLRLHSHGLRIIERPVNNFLPLPDGDSLTAYVTPADFTAEVARFSTRDAASLEPFQASLARIGDIFRSLMTEAPPRLDGGRFADIVPLFNLGRQLNHLSAADRRELLRLFSVSAGTILDDVFESSPLKALIGFDAIVGNFASPYQAGSAYVMLHHTLGEVNGKRGRWGHAIGGMGAISDAMRLEAESRGVKIETDAAVQEVLVDKGRACGVRTASGEHVPADLVVAGINPKLLYLDLLDSRLLAAETLQHFRRYRCASGSFRMNVALSGVPRFSADTPPDALSGGIIMAPDLGYMDRAYHDARRHGWSREPIVEMLIPSLVDDSLAPPGAHVASLFCQQFDPGLGSGWQAARRAAAETVLDTVERFAPGFRALVLGMQVMSPWDLEQTFGLTGGDIFHGQLSPDQLFSARPMLGAGRYATEIRGLFMCGAGTHPGGGVSGLPGRNAAREILRRL